MLLDVLVVTMLMRWENILSDESCEYLYEIGSWDNCALSPPFVRRN
jgi:hypothetical protein